MATEADSNGGAAYRVTQQQHLNTLMNMDFSATASPKFGTSSNMTTAQRQQQLFASLIGSIN
jgi:hypothetical protein